MTAKKSSTEASGFLKQVKTLWEGEGLALKDLGDSVARSMRGDRSISLKFGAEIAQVLWNVHIDSSNGKDLQPKIQRFWDNLGRELNKGSSLPVETDFEALKKLFLERLGFRLEPAREDAPLQGDAFDPQQAKQSHDFVTWAGSSDSVNLAIIFTDIIGAARHNNQLGDAGWRPLRTAHFAQADKLVKKHEGYRVKTIGDGVFAVFRNSVAALRFAQEFESDPGHPSLRVRVGAHTGEVEIQENDAFGQSVNLAARICAQAKQGGIWVSERVHDDWLHRDPKNVLPWTRHDNVQLKGFPDLFVLWSLPPTKVPQPSECLKNVVVGKPGPAVGIVGKGFVAKTVNVDGDIHFH